VLSGALRFVAEPGQFISVSSSVALPPPYRTFRPSRGGLSHSRLCSSLALATLDLYALGIEPANPLIFGQDTCIGIHCADVPVGRTKGVMLGHVNGPLHPVLPRGCSSVIAVSKRSSVQHEKLASVVPTRVPIWPGFGC